MRISLLIVSLLIASAAAAESDLYIVPVAGHARGAFGTAWRTDLVLHNVQAVPVHVEIALVEGERVVAVGTPVEIAPGETRVLADVVGALGRDAVGALIVGAELPFVVTSHTYAEGTLGQSVMPIDVHASSETGVLAGLAHGDQQRANTGMFIAASATPFVAEIRLLSASGATIATHFVTLSEAGFAHRQMGIPESGVASAIVRVVQGEGIVVPYASIIDNRSAAAMFVAEEAVSGGGVSAQAMIRSAVRGR